MGKILRSLFHCGVVVGGKQALARGREERIPRIHTLEIVICSMWFICYVTSIEFSSGLSKAHLSPPFPGKVQFHLQQANAKANAQSFCFMILWAWKSPPGPCGCRPAWSFAPGGEGQEQIGPVGSQARERASITPCVSTRSFFKTTS